MRISDWSSDVCSSDLWRSCSPDLGAGLSASVARVSEAHPGFRRGGIPRDVGPGCGLWPYPGYVADLWQSPPPNLVDEVPGRTGHGRAAVRPALPGCPDMQLPSSLVPSALAFALDRKSTRLNSSH